MAELPLRRRPLSELSPREKLALALVDEVGEVLSDFGIEDDLGEDVLDKLDNRIFWKLVEAKS